MPHTDEYYIKKLGKNEGDDTVFYWYYPFHPISNIPRNKSENWLFSKNQRFCAATFI